MMDWLKRVLCCGVAVTCAVGCASSRNPSTVRRTAPGFVTTHPDANPIAVPASGDHVAPPVRPETFVHAAGWSVKRSGPSLVVERPGVFAFELPTAESDREGFTVVEACERRVKFVSRGTPKMLTVY